MFDHRFYFVSTKYTIKEVEKYIHLISKKSGVKKEEIYKALFLLPIKIYGRKDYQYEIMKAENIISKIDKKDVDILALSLNENCPVWSEDKDFRDKKEINLVRTKDLL